MREGWKEVTINDVCSKVTSGGTPLRKYKEYYGGNIPWIKTKQVNYNRIYDSEEYLTELGLANSSAKLIPKNSIIIAMYGDGNTAGRCAISKVDATTNQACCNLIVDNDIADYNFIFYFLSTQYDKLVSLKSGAGQQNLNAQIIKGFEFKIPPLETQRKIANILSGYDDLIENNQKRIKILEEMAQQTYEEWFVRMRFPGYETAAFDENGLPEGWEKVILNDIANVKGGKRLPQGHDLIEAKTEHPYIRVKDLADGSVDLSSLVYISKETHLQIHRYTISEDDIYISIAGTIGLVGIIPPIISNANLTENCAKITDFNNAFLQNYICLFLQNTEGQHFIKARTGGASQPKLALNKIAAIPIIIPKANVLKNFSTLTKSIRSNIQNLQSQNQRLREARDILLPRLMMGMIDVSGSTVQVESVVLKPTDAKIIPLEQPKKEASKEFKEAVLIACLTERFGSEKFPLGRKRYTKLSYLFHRYSDNKIQDYLRKAAGPYNPKTKYGGPEKIALNNKYIQNWKSDNKLTGFVSAEKIEDAKTYFSNYWQIADLDWLTTEFKFKSNDELELLATVDNSLVELSKKNLEFTSTNVLDIIKSEKEWEAKLERTIFSDANVERAIQYLQTILQY